MVEYIYMVEYINVAKQKRRDQWVA